MLGSGWVRSGMARFAGARFGVARYLRAVMFSGTLGDVTARVSFCVFWFRSAWRAVTVQRAGLNEKTL